MHNVEIDVFPIAQSRMNRDQMRDWLDRIGADEYPVPRTEYARELVFNEEEEKQPEVTECGAIIGLAAKRCYMSFEPGLNPNVTRVRKDWFDYLSNILKSKHGSVTEHATWTWAIEGVSRVFTGEMNRHRAGVAISEGSMRYIRFDDIPFWMPRSLDLGNQLLRVTYKCDVCGGHGDYDDPNVGNTMCYQCHGAGRLPELDEDEFEKLKVDTQRIFRHAFQQMEDNIKLLYDKWDINEGNFGQKKKLTSLFRRIIGMGVATGGIWTFNIRALRHIIALRTSAHAEEEIAYVVGLIAKTMVESEPALFGDFVLDEATGCWRPEHVKI